MSEPVRRTGRTCEVRVHEQIRRNTRTRGGGCILDRRRRSRRRPAANVSVVSGYRTRTASPPKRHKTSCRRPGRAVMFEGLSPKRWSGEGCAAPSPPQSLHRDRDLSSFRRSPLAPYDRASRGGRAKLPRALVDPWATRQASPIAEHQLIRRKQAQQIPKRSLQWKGPTNKDRIRQGGTCPIDQRCNQRGMRCHYERDRTGDIHADSVEIIENRMALCAG